MIFEIIREHQLNIMLCLTAICMMMAVLLLMSHYLSRRRKWELTLMELFAAVLLACDRATYIYEGDTSAFGGTMTSLSNFMVFFLKPVILLVFNLYLTDLFLNEGKLQKIPLRLRLVNLGAVIGMGLVILSHFTGFYYYFDDLNQYHRGAGFLVSYAVPVICPLIQFSVIRQYRERFSRLIYLSLVFYIFIPLVFGIIQFFTYGISVVTMAMVLVSIFLYMFIYLDINNEAQRAHALEVGNLQKEQQSMKRLFDQTVTAFVRAVEKRAARSKGHSARVAQVARMIAVQAGKNAEECDEVYYAALLHDVGITGIPDTLLRKTKDLTDAEHRLKRSKPEMSAEILSCITEYPYLSEGAHYCRERYDGTGYPEGRRGTDIPEISRIIAVADAYDSMITGKHSQTPLSYQVVREELIKGAGVEFDPQFAEIMVQIMDEKRTEQGDIEPAQIETELTCHAYRETVSAGIPVEETITRIRFESEALEGSFSAPSLIVFDAYDRHIHSDTRTIEAYHYLEYAELWFDGHTVSTNTRNMRVQVKEEGSAQGYEVTAGRFEDHISVRMQSPERTVEIILALPDNSKAAYIGVTGEHCHIRGLTVEKTGEVTSAETIPKIVEKITYTDRLESDLPNLQIDHPRSAATRGIAVENELTLQFHTMTLPSGNLVWHCPYIVLFDARDGQVGGKDYKEFTLIKLNGESASGTRDVENNLRMKRHDSFPGWNVWKQKHKEGLECTVHFVRRGGRITVTTENLGLSIEHTLLLPDKQQPVYAALTGDEVALTDIRVR